MKNFAHPQTLSKFLSPILVLSTIATPALAQEQFAPGPITAPNVKLTVRANGGTCPKTVGLWWLVLPYEGGAEHTVIADTNEFTETAKLVSSSPQFVEFAAPLRSGYADCEGQTQAGEFDFYSLRFKDKKAYFRIDLRKINAPAKVITYKAVVASRPYVRWAIAD
ncbi:MAG TPA: hypothetical protein VK203_16700 [Nostocaceae cyanobacterium]|nr:hypothetical protein [Nostocaceae cyanobacterium]